MTTETCQVAFCHYAATGEGCTVILAVAGSAYRAEMLFKERTNEFFHIGMEVVPLDDTKRKGIGVVTDLIPPYALKEFLKNPPGTTEYYSHLHFNLS